MKTSSKVEFNSKYLSTSLCFFLFLFMACQSKTDPNVQSNSTSQITLPILLDRPSAIQYAHEWDLVQNTYGQNKAAINQNPENHSALLKLAELFLNEARVTGEHGHYYPAALQMCEHTLKTAENKDIVFQAKALKASALLSQHDFAKALTIAQEAVALNPYNAQIMGALVDAQVEMGNYKEAIAAADRMMAIRPDLRSYARVSYLRELNGDVPGALKALELALSAGYPGYEETAWTALTYGELLQANGEIEKAKAVYENILEQRPDYPFAIAALANIQFKQGNIRTAEKMLNDAIQIIPEVGFYIDLAKIFKFENRTTELNSICKSIEDMFKDDVDSGHNMNLELADFYLNITEEFPRAEKFAKKEFQKRPKNIQVNELLGQIYMAMNDVPAARQHTEMGNLKNVLSNL